MLKNLTVYKFLYTQYISMLTNIDIKKVCLQCVLKLDFKDNLEQKILIYYL